MKEYYAIPKVKAPACCNISCCGNKFGKIEHKPSHKVNRKKLSRRYFCHAIKNRIHKEVQLCLN